MTALNSARGLALVCSQEGVILKVLHNDLGIDECELVGKPLPMLVARSSFQKALSFVAQLKALHSAFDWDLILAVGRQTIPVHCTGLTFQDNLMVMAAQSRVDVNHLFVEMMRINNDQTNLARSDAKQAFESNTNRREPDLTHYNELTALNNELVGLHRELAQKNIQLERLNTEVQRLAIIDELTHLYNRRGFFDIGRREVERASRSGSLLSLIMIDIDRFKDINDAHGHTVGDKVLQEVANRCTGQLRMMDSFGRYGGEEFSALLPETSIDGAEKTAERLRRTIADEPIRIDGGLLAVTVSLGVAALNSDILGLEQLLDVADRALYQAKRSGRNMVSVAPADNWCGPQASAK